MRVNTTNYRNLGFRNFALTETQLFPIRSKWNSANDLYEANAYLETEVNLDLVTVSRPFGLKTGIPETPSESLVLYTKIEILGEFNKVPKGFINQTTWVTEQHGGSPLLTLPKEDWGTAFVPFVKSGSDRWVDIVLNNFDDKGHPFHLVCFPYCALFISANIMVFSMATTSLFWLYTRRELVATTRRTTRLSLRKSLLVDHSTS